MAWVRLEPNYYHHPKLAEVGSTAELLWVRGLCYAARYDTDGALPAHVRRVIGAEDVSKAAQNRAIQRLVEAGLWTRTDDGYQIHDYLEFQPSKEQNAQRKATDRQRLARWRETQKPSGNGVSNAHVTALQEPW